MHSLFSLYLHLIGSDMLLADQFYSSGTFWAAAGTLVGIAVGAASIYVIWRQGNPIRSLRYGMSTAGLLQGAAQEMPGTHNLQKIIHISPRNQPTVMRALSTFIRNRSPAGNSDVAVTSGIQDALDVLELATRPMTMER
jgi:hypothetical protein